MSTLFFVHSDAIEADNLAATYRGRGWSTAISSASAADAVDRVSETQPVAAVFCLEGECIDDVEALAEKVMADPRGPRPLMVFVDGSPDAVLRARQVAPRGIFVSSEELPWVLKRLVSNS